MAAKYNATVDRIYLGAQVDHGKRFTSIYPANEHPIDRRRADTFIRNRRRFDLPILRVGRGKFGVALHGPWIVAYRPDRFCTAGVRMGG